MRKYLEKHENKWVDRNDEDKVFKGRFMRDLLVGDKVKTVNQYGKLVEIRVVEKKETNGLVTVRTIEKELGE